MARPPKGMKCHIYEFNQQVGGTFRMSYDYMDTRHEVAGKTSEHADIILYPSKLTILNNAVVRCENKM